MRIRSIRPEFWSSEDVAEMDWHTRLVYIGLWSYVDDNGVGRDNERLITAALFPLDADLPESSRRVTGALRHLSSHGQIVRYTSSGKRYLHICKWLTHQRIEKASKGRYPLPTCDDTEITEPSPTSPGTLPEMSPIGEGEKGRSGEGEKDHHADSDAPRADVLDLCDALSEALTHNGVKHTIGKRWHTAARLILDADGRPFDEVIEVIDYATTDDFWRPNILSMTKLREKYDTLRLQMQRKPPMSNQGSFYARELARIEAKERGGNVVQLQLGTGS